MPCRSALTVLTASLLLSLLAAAGNAQGTKRPAKKPAKKKPSIVTAKAYLPVDRLPAGKTCDVIILVRIQKPWHINANPAGDEFAVVTELSMKSKYGPKLTKVRYPKGKKLAVEGFEKPLSVYTDRVVLRGTIQIPAKAGGKRDQLELAIRYQACDDRRCLRPMTLKITIPMKVGRTGEAVKKINQRLFHPPKRKTVKRKQKS